VQPTLRFRVSNHVAYHGKKLTVGTHFLVRFEVLGKLAVCVFVCLLACSACSSTLKMAEVRSYELAINFYQTTTSSSSTSYDNSFLLCFLVEILCRG
jgi:hypothetical protein